MFQNTLIYYREIFFLSVSSNLSHLIFLQFFRTRFWHYTICSSSTSSKFLKQMKGTVLALIATLPPAYPVHGFRSLQTRVLLKAFINFSAGALEHHQIELKTAHCVQNTFGRQTVRMAKRKSQNILFNSRLIELLVSPTWVLLSEAKYIMRLTICAKPSLLRNVMLENGYHVIGLISENRKQLPIHSHTYKLLNLI